MHEQSSWPHSPWVKPLQPAQRFPLQPVPCCGLPAATFLLLVVPAGSTHQTSPYSANCRPSRAKSPFPGCSAFLNPAPGFPALLCRVRFPSVTFPNHKVSGAERRAQHQSFHVPFPGMLNSPTNPLPQIPAPLPGSSSQLRITLQSQGIQHTQHFSAIEVSWSWLCSLQLLHLC